MFFSEVFLHLLEPTINTHKHHLEWQSTFPSFDKQVAQQGSELLAGRTPSGGEVDGHNLVLESFPTSDCFGVRVRIMLVRVEVGLFQQLGFNQQLTHSDTSDANTASEMNVTKVL